VDGKYGYHWIFRQCLGSRSSPNPPVPRDLLLFDRRSSCKRANIDPSAFTTSSIIPMSQPLRVSLTIPSRASATSPTRILPLHFDEKAIQSGRKHRRVSIIAEFSAVNTQRNIVHTLYVSYGVPGIGAILFNKRPPHSKELEIPKIMGDVVPHWRRQDVYEFCPKALPINNLMSHNPDTKRGDSP